MMLRYFIAIGSILFLASCKKNEGGAMRLLSAKQANPKSAEAPVDLNKPVENPTLKKAIAVYKAKRNLKTQADLGKELSSAHYLVAILTDEMRTTPETDGHVTIEKDSVIEFLDCCNEKGERFLPAFTDWAEIRMWTTQKVATIVMPADHLWGFVLQGDQYSGLVINPAGTHWTMSKDNVRALQEEFKK